jgi:hypothetical protein
MQEGRARADTARSRIGEKTFMDEHLRLRLASRINHLLLRELGEGVDVGMLLKRAPYATEVLYVCAASGNPELKALGEEFARVTRAYHERIVREMEGGAAPGADSAPPTQASAWPSGASDFSASRPMDANPARRRATGAVKSSFAPWGG